MSHGVGGKTKRNNVKCQQAYLKSIRAIKLQLSRYKDLQIAGYSTIYYVPVLADYMMDASSVCGVYFPTFNVIEMFHERCQVVVGCNLLP